MADSADDDDKAARGQMRKLCFIFNFVALEVFKILFTGEGEC